MVECRLIRNTVFIEEVKHVLSNDFEKAFGDFIDRREYDQAETALFAMVRIAFLAGWKAAGGDPPQPQKIFQLMHRENIDSTAIDTDLSK
ncbi:hypothetical protein DSECCO2_227120 [anaerobic digester metagenome]